MRQVQVRTALSALRTLGPAMNKAESAQLGAFFNKVVARLEKVEKEAKKNKLKRVPGNNKSVMVDEQGGSNG